jgi:hypothetical protein
MESNETSVGYKTRIFVSHPNASPFRANADQLGAAISVSRGAALKI